MELAVVGGGTAGEQQVRLKLHFEDRSILNAEQLQDGLSDSWFLLASHLRSISDLASHIIIAFGLHNSCPHGISLRMENFILPPPQSVWLLRDKDIVSVSKKYLSPDAALQQGKHAALLGVKVRALEEFERETGGYESEQEEENGALETRKKDRALKKSFKKSKEKKRKWEKIERDDDQCITKLQVVPYTGGLTREKEREKKSKKQRLIVQQDDNKSRKEVNDKMSNKEVIIIQQTDELHECAKDKKVKEPESCNAIKNKKKKEQVIIGDVSVKQPTIEKQTSEMQECAKDKKVKEHESSNSIKNKKKKKEQVIIGDVSLKQPTIGKQHALKGSSSSEEMPEGEERKSGLPGELEIVKKPSRSTLRKKAKRRWRREHGELAKNYSHKGGDDSRKAPAHKDFAEQPSSNFTSKHEDDGDAEEERLPRVIRPGHIRFEPLDEDEDDHHHPHSPLPLLAWSNGISKRKGQSWGQEKGKRGSRNLEVIGDMEICDTQEVHFEGLPALEGTPQNGDLIAYRILELTSSFCPELSEYRVGKVVDFESQSGALKLAEVPKYPLRRRQGDYDAETNEDVPFSSLYDKEGFLETQISSLADIRLVEGSSQEACKIVPTKQVSAEFATTDRDMNFNTSTVDSQMDVEKTSGTNRNSNTFTHDTLVDVDKSCSTNPSVSEAHIQIKEFSPASFQEWPELFEVLERKKQELGDKEGIMSSGAAELDKAKSENGCASTINNSAKAANARGSKGWLKRAGGLGATMALLRSQNMTSQTVEQA